MLKGKTYIKNTNLDLRCPRCGAKEKFPIIIEPYGKMLYRIYTRCTSCKKENELRKIDSKELNRILKNQKIKNKEK